MLVGLIAVCLLGVVGIGVGIVWAVWPRSSKASAPAPTAAVPTAPPVVDEPRKTLDDLINNAPKRPDLRPKINVPAELPPEVRVGPRRPIIPPVGDEPKRPQPGPRPAPEFVPVTPLPITPPTMARAIEDHKLPAPAESGVVAAGGKLILLHLPQSKTIGVFDVTTRTLKHVPTGDGTKPMIAGGMNFFLVYQPDRNTVERYSTRTLEREATVRAGFGGQVAALGVGHATNGPLAAVIKGERNGRPGGGVVEFFDPFTLQRLGYDVTTVEENAFGLNPFGGVSLRVSADGSVATAWGVRGSGGEIHAIDGRKVTRRFHHDRYGSLMPSADGRTLYGPGGVFTPDGQPIGTDDPRRLAPWDRPSYVPSVHGDFVLALTPQRSGGDRPPKAEIFLGREKKALHWMGDMQEAEAPRIGEPKEDYDRQFFLIPDAKLLVVIDGRDRSRLLLHRLDLDEALAKWDAEYLYVATRPPTAAVVGETYRYAPVVKAKTPGWTASLESGPPGMTVGRDGAVSWAVPKDFSEPAVTVILKFAGGTKEVFQTVRLQVRKAK